MACNENLLDKITTNMDEDFCMNKKPSQVLLYKNKSYNQPF